MAAFVVDEDLPDSLAQALRTIGHSAISVREARLASSPDREIYRFAQARRATIITADLDFASIIDYPIGEHFGIVVARLSQIYAPAQVSRILEALAEGMEDLQGCLVIVEPSRIRIRRP